MMDTHKSVVGEVKPVAPKLSSDVRTRLIEQLRREIAAGRYECSARLDGALDGLLDDLNLQPRRAHKAIMRNEAAA